MPQQRKVYVSDIDFHVFEKSVQVCTPAGHEWVFFGKKVEDRDIRTLARLVGLGRQLQRTDTRELMARLLRVSRENDYEKAEFRNTDYIKGRE
jgi:hypothetical protein